MTNIILSGVGGQGILLLGKIIATAAELSGFQVTTNEIHGMAQRGGSVTAQIRFGAVVRSPLILEGTADALGALEEIEALRYAHYLRPGGLAAVAAQKIIPVTVSTGTAVYPPDSAARLRRTFPRLLYCDCAAIAATLGSLRLANTVLLGALSAGLSFSPEIWNTAISRCVKPAFAAANHAAFAAGQKCGTALHSFRRA